MAGCGLVITSRYLIFPANSSKRKEKKSLNRLLVYYKKNAAMSFQQLMDFIQETQYLLPLVIHPPIFFH